MWEICVGCVVTKCEMSVWGVVVTKYGSHKGWEGWDCVTFRIDVVLQGTPSWSMHV